MQDIKLDKNGKPELFEDKTLPPPEEDEIISVGLKSTNYTNLIDRYYYKIYYNTIKDQNNTEQYIFIHSNCVALCGLSKNHFISEKARLGLISEIVDLNKVIKVSGKKKRGARLLNENEYIIEIHYFSDEKAKEKNDKSIFKFSPSIKQGKLMEVNNNITDLGFINSNTGKVKELLGDSSEKFGFICMILLDHIQVETLKKKFSNEEKVVEIENNKENDN